MFKIIWTEKSSKQLDNLNENISSRIVKKVDELSENPFSKDIKKLKGESAFRLRVGDYRIIFDIDIKNNIIYILRLGHRKNIYD